MLLISVALPGTAAPGAAATAPRTMLRLKPVPFTAVTINDSFWAPRRETNRRVTISHALRQLEDTGTLGNFDLAAARAKSGHKGYVFQDSDAYKTLEAIAYTLATDPDPELDAQADDVIARIAKAQQPDGYLNTYYTINGLDKRWTNLRDNHELYCAGHLFEAAVAHFQATGKRNLLNVAIRFADHIVRRFGDGPGKVAGYPGHPEIELALVKLADVTGRKEYFDLAAFFVSRRGTGYFAREHGTPPAEYDGTYWQDQVPIREQKSIVGHAVRAAYLMSGVTDVAARTGDAGLLAMLDRVWKNTTTRRMYVTGGLGPSGSNEGFTEDYDLPNLTAYQETCASIANAMWNHRLALLYGDSRYADVMETALYNGALAGVSLDGTRFFYVNPLASEGTHHRSEWFGCACCPPNIMRTLAFIGGYAYATSADALWVNLYIRGSVKAEVAGARVSVGVATDYPWDGMVRLSVNPAKETAFGLRLRVPAWCPNPRVRVNDDAWATPVVENGYAVLTRTWKAGDQVELDLPMAVRRIAAHPRVQDDVGKLAVARGPLIYAFEAVDNPVSPLKAALPVDAPLTVQSEPNLLGGIRVITGEGIVADSADWRGVLYRTAPAPVKAALKAIPYALWDNRAAGPMAVWLPVAPPPPPAGGPEMSAAVTLSFTSRNASPGGINDGKPVTSSRSHPGQLTHFWPHKGGSEWVQYTWQKPLTVEGCRVYWFDDTGSGECRLPASWKVSYLDGQTWKPVQGVASWPVTLDAWDEVRFEPVTTTALRLEIEMQPQWAVGIHEWQVIETEE